MAGIEDVVIQNWVGILDVVAKHLLGTVATWGKRLFERFKVLQKMDALRRIGRLQRAVFAVRNR